ncbi:MAG TPA: hypothetical protein VM580_07145 [Labilithrix sp.]|nr:hypothetical protein [Labilithrix sp.]
MIRDDGTSARVTRSSGRKWTPVAIAAALLVPIPRTLPTEPAAPAAVAPPGGPPVATETAPAAPLEGRTFEGRTIAPIETWSSARDARSLAADSAYVWVATGGGLDRYTQSSRERRHFGVEDGLDTLDVRSVETTEAGIVVQTATSRCAMSGERFTCTPAQPPAAKADKVAPFHGHPVTARLRVGPDAYVATRGGGAFFVPSEDASKAVPLAAIAGEPESFVHTGAVFRGALWLGTFHDGLYRVPLGRDGRPVGTLATSAKRVKSPARLLNRVLATGGKAPALYIGASEGVFVSRDGSTFSRLGAIGPHAITGLAATEQHLWVTSTEALYRLALDGQGPVQRAFVRPAGSRAIQSVAIDAEGTAWLATEDRGVVRVAPDGAIHGYDRVAGLPSSWFVAVDADGAGGAIATSLRHGTVHIARDGSWSTIDWAPSAWGLAIRRDAQRTCIATQGGARCETTRGEIESLALLPDARVHVFLPLGGTTLVGTEAGVAVYRL